MRSPAKRRSEALAHVSLSSSLAVYTGGETQCELHAANIRQLFQALGERYPELLPRLKTEVAVSIDGEVYQDALLQSIAEDSELYLFPRIAGG